MHQSVTIVGNLGSDPELRYMPNGDPVANFSVATNRRWGEGGDAKEETTWFRVSVFRKQAEVCNQYLSKGRLVLVEGRLRPGDDGGPRTWTAQDGTVRASYEITASTVRFLGGSESAGQQAGSGQAASSGNPNKEEDEIPF